MEQFMSKHGERVIGVLSGWDRVVLRGTYRILCSTSGMMYYLSQISLLLRDFTEHAKTMTAMLIDASYEESRRLDRPTLYLPSSKEGKEKRALEFLCESPVDSGLVCVLSCVDRA